MFDEPVGDLLKRDETGLKAVLQRCLKKEVEEALREMGWHPSEGNPDVWIAPERDAGE